MSEQIWQAGEYNLLEANWMLAGGTTVDVRNQVESILIYEDIFKPFSSAVIVMVDTLDIPGSIGQFSRDLFKVKIETPGLAANTQINLIFHIDSIERRRLRNDRLQSYILNLVSVEYVQDLHTQISKTFSGTGDSITEKIVTEYMQCQLPLVKEQSSFQIKYTSNFWSPIKNIEYCKLHSSSIKGSPLYFFFQSRLGFYYVSLDYLINQGVFQTFDGSDYVAEVNFDKSSINFGETRRNPNKDWSVIRGEPRVDKWFDYTKLYQSGGFKSDLITHDLLTKSYKNIRWVANKDKRVKLNTHFGFTDGTYETAGAVRITASNYYDVNDRGNVSDSKLIQKRHSEFAELLTFKVQIDVLGRTDYTVGQKMFLTMNRPKVISVSDTQADFYDYHLSGNYIVTAINHQFGRAGHISTLELSKESSLASRNV